MALPLSTSAMSIRTSEGIHYRKEYHELLGDVVAALVMSQIHYWYSPTKEGKSKLRVLKDGQWWIAKSVHEWAEECGLSYKQVRRALEMLEQVGLVEIQTFRYNKVPLTHLRFALVYGRGPIHSVPDLSELSNKPAGGFALQGKPSALQGEGCAPQGEGFALQGKSITEITHETTTETTQGADAQMEVGMKLSSKGKALDSSKAILAKLSAPAKLDAYQVSPSGIYYLWVNTVPTFFPEVGCQKKFTMKQQGFINQLISLWGAEDTREILAYTIEHWIRFTKYAEENAGAFKSPLLPSIDYLYKFGAEAKNFWLARTAAKDLGVGSLPTPPKKLTIMKTTEKVQPVQSVAPAIDEDDKEMTLDELVKWKADQAAGKHE